MHTTAGEDTTTLVIGSGPEDHRLGDVRVMLPGLLAQRVTHLCVDLTAAPKLGDAQLAELCRLQASCAAREIDLDLVGLDQSACESLRRSATRPRVSRVR